MALSFFFQAEDGIRDKLVTGVQTCALPISARQSEPPRFGARREARDALVARVGRGVGEVDGAVLHAQPVRLSGGRSGGGCGSRNDDEGDESLHVSILPGYP